MYALGIFAFSCGVWNFELDTFGGTVSVIPDLVGGVNAISSTLKSGVVRFGYSGAQSCCSFCFRDWVSCNFVGSS